MSDYPSTPQSYRSTLESFSDAPTRILTTANGVPRLVVMGSLGNSYYSINLIHELLEKAVRDTHIQHYKNNYNTSFNMVAQDDGEVFICFYNGKPIWTPVEGAYWEVSSKLVGHPTSY